MSGLQVKWKSSARVPSQPIRVADSAVTVVTQFRGAYVAPSVTNEVLVDFIQVQRENRNWALLVYRPPPPVVSGERVQVVVERVCVSPR